MFLKQPEKRIYNPSLKKSWHKAGENEYYIPLILNIPVKNIATTKKEKRKVCFE